MSLRRSHPWGPLLLTVLTACSGTGDERGNGGRDLPDANELDRLRALPYVGSTPVGSDDGVGVVRYDAARSQPGPTLYTVQMHSRAELIDLDGTVLHSWAARGPGRWERAELLADGDLLVVGADGVREDQWIPDNARYLLRLDWQGRVRWKRTMLVHHDVEQAADGELTVLAFRRTRIPRIHPEIDVREDLVVRLDDTGEPRAQISLLEAFVNGSEVVRLASVGPSSVGVVPWIDLFHANSVLWMRRPERVGRHPIYAPENVLVSLRHQNLVAVVNWPRREVLWAWGRDELLGPHDARLLDSGHLLVFDNGLGRGYSRVLEIDPLLGEVVWEYRADPPQGFYTASKGSSQRLPNGNTLIADSDNGRAFEVTPSKEVVWEFYCPYEGEPGQRAAIVRAIRYDPGLLARLGM